MNFWKILGIEPTRDIKQIKAAYAGMAKLYHPEEYPQEFQQLQTAYKAALSYAKGQEEKFEKVQDISQNIERQENNEEQEYKVTQQQVLQLQQEARESTARKEPPTVKVSFDTENEENSRIPESEANKEIPPVRISPFFYGDMEEDILDVANDKNRFWKELEYLLWHPMARQSWRIWKYFLEQTKYKQLFQTREFREEFINRLGKENFYWFSSTEEERDTCRCIAKFVNSFDVKVLPEFENSIYERIKSNGIGTFASCVSERERKVYNPMWRTQSEETINAKDYLTVYFQYAEDHEDELREIHTEAHEIRIQRRQKRKKRLSLIGKLILLFLLALRIYMRWQRFGE